jgi:hypothetical protein
MSHGAVQYLTGNSGGNVYPDGIGNINVVGSGTISVTGNTSTNTLTISGGGGPPPPPYITWNDVPGNSQTMVADNGYVADNAGLCTMTLPVTAAFGTILFVVGNGAGGWKIAQHAGQNIRLGSAGSTTVGTGGSLASTNQYDSIQLLCVVADTTWNSISMDGNITII